MEANPEAVNGSTKAEPESSNGLARAEPEAINDSTAIADTTEPEADQHLDRGWSWVVLGATFVSFFIMQGQLLTGNIYFIIYLREFGESRSITAFTGAAYTATVNLTGPLASILLRKFGPRFLLMVGGFIVSCGFLCIFPAQTMGQVIFASGVIRGVGACFIMSGCQAALTVYFSKRLYVATGIMYSASAIGMMTVGLLTEYVVGAYGWRGSLVIQAGLSLHICLCGALVFRVPERRRTVAVANSRTSAAAPRQYLRDVRFWCISGCTTMLFMFTSIVVLFWKDILPHKNHFKVAVVAMAAGSTLGRATAGFVSSRVAPPLHNCAVAACNALVVLGFLVSDRVWVVAVHNLAWGFFNGQQTVADRLQLAWVFGRLDMPIVLGYSLIFVGVGGFMAPPLAGFITDSTGNYLGTLIMTSAFSALGAVLSLVLYFTHRRKLKQVPSIESSNEDATEVLNKTDVK